MALCTCYICNFIFQYPYFIQFIIIIPHMTNNQQVWTQENTLNKVQSVQTYMSTVLSISHPITIIYYIYKRNQIHSNKTIINKTKPRGQHTPASK